ncbi:hypothetical protein KR51_00028250, partial [Rubidibacter lacunae KORDI 51-2]
MKSILGSLTLTSEQAQRLQLKPRSQLSPLLERCCLRVSANVSYQHTAEDIELLTGIPVSAKTQHRLVHRQSFPAPQASAPVTEASLDGGTVRLVVKPGQPPRWKQYKAAYLGPGKLYGAWFDDNAALVTWLNEQPLAKPVTCLGDGHDGIWNLFAQMPPTVERREVLDWYHLMENLEKVGGTPQRRRRQARQLLWQGKVAATRALFKNCRQHQAQCFRRYLRKHRVRIPNYEYLQSEEVCAIGSGGVESTVKQIDQRLKISGARWEEDNVPQVLAHRCAYLNKRL